MTKNDWQEAGDQFKKLVQDAVDSNDFSRLGTTLTNVVNDTVDGLQSALQENLSRAQQTAAQKARDTQDSMSRKAWDAQDSISRKIQGAGEAARDKYQYTNSAAAERIRRNLQEKRRAAQEGEREKKLPARIKAPGEITGNVMKWTGYSMGGMFGLAAGVLGIVSLTTGAWLGLPTGILLLLFGTNMVIGASGSRKVELARRFRRYMTVLGDRTYCLVEELASSVGQNSKFVKKDLKKMISRGYFKEGYLDSRETMLITDRSTYQQYLSTQTEYERRRMQEEAQAEIRSEEHGSPRAGETASSEGHKTGGTQPGSGGKKNENLTPECREILEEGRRYIQHIHECNEKIPGEEISAKLDRLELVVTKIFREAERNPDCASDLNKLMSYYLPTTTKLLDAYCEMDAQPIAGRNIENTKKEIENALDTINTAFENLLDSLFQDEAWDISSDITVLHTMLAQEGLAGNDFAQKQGGK